MNGRVAVTLIRAARREAEEKGTVAKGIYRNLKRIHKTKPEPKAKRSKKKGESFEDKYLKNLAIVAEEGFGIKPSCIEGFVRRNNLNSRQRRRNLVAKSFANN